MKKYMIIVGACLLLFYLYDTNKEEVVEPTHSIVFDFEKPNYKTGPDIEEVIDLLTESLRLNASYYGLTLYDVEYREDLNQLCVYIDNYQGEELKSKEAKKAIFLYSDSYYNLDYPYKIKFKFHPVVTMWDGPSKMMDSYSYLVNIHGERCLYNSTGSEIIYKTTEERKTIYSKYDTYEDIKSAITNNNNMIRNQGYEIQEYQSIHYPTNPPGTYNITEYRNDGTDYDPSDYSNAYDFFYEHQDELSEDEAYEIYEQYYGE